ncbi:MAG: hypothetical protein AB1451_05840 [Nitrospirota bacterium]
MNTLARIVVMGSLLWGGAAIPAHAAIERTFGAGSLIIPMDGDTYQPSADGGVYEAYGFIYKLLDRKAADGTPDPIPVYWIIDDSKTVITGVDLTISNVATDPVATEHKALGEIAISGVGTQITYNGGPFVIDSNYAAAAKTIWASGFQDVNLHVAKVPFTGKVQREMFGTPPKIALMNDSESRTGNATKILEGYLKIAGIQNPATDDLGNACAYTDASGTYFPADPVVGSHCTYDVLTPNEVGGIQTLAGTALNGKSKLFDYTCTGCATKPKLNYRVLWVPHWVGFSDYNVTNGQYISVNTNVGTMSVTKADVHDIVMAVRDFVDLGGSLFAECAGIETFEWSEYGRFITKYDLGHNGGTNDSTKIYYNKDALDQPYVQIGDMAFDPEGGHLHNWRPFQTGDPRADSLAVNAMAFNPSASNPKSTYTQSNTGYDGTVTVFTYDDNSVPAGTSPAPNVWNYGNGDQAKQQWHYYVAGHMDGDQTNGYVVYLGGHSYVNCSGGGGGGGGAAPAGPNREIDFEFRDNVDNSMDGTFTITFSYTIAGDSTVYTVTQSGITKDNITTLTATGNNPGGGVELVFTTAAFEAKGSSGTDATKLKKIKGVHFKNNRTTDVNITQVQVSVTGVSGLKLRKIKDVTENDTKFGTETTLPVTANINSNEWIVEGSGGGAGGGAGSYDSGCTPKGTSGAGIRYVLNTVFQLDAVTDREFVRSGPVVFKDFLYQGSFDYPSFGGHFRKFQVNADLGAGRSGLKRVDDFGGNDPSSPGDAAPKLTSTTAYSDNNSNRRVDANELTGRKIYACATTGLKNADGTENAEVLDSSNCGMTQFKYETAATFQPRMLTTGLATTQEVIVKRYGMQYDANNDEWEKKDNVMGGIEHSTAAIIGPSALTSMSRPTVAYLGALDGMLHAVKAGVKTEVELPEAADAGTELWSYIPSSQLPRLQYFRDPNAISTYPAVDASVAFAEVESSVGSGTYKTVLLITMGVGGNSIAALDVTDPTVTPPVLLWERSGVDDDTAVSKTVAMGNGSKVAIGRVVNASGSREYRAFVTTALKDKEACQDANGSPLGDGSLCGGLQIYSFDLLTGEQKWRFERVYRSGINDVPGSLALVDADQNGDEDYVVAGDMEGNLWLLPTAPDYDGNGTEDKKIFADSTFTDGASSTTADIISDIPPLYAPSRDENACTTYPGTPDPCYEAGHDQPIGASPTVVVKDGRIYLAWGTGGAQWARAGDYYSVYVLEITGLDPYNLVDGSGALRDAQFGFKFVLDQGEKVFGALTYSQGFVYFGTAFGSVEGLNLKDDVATNNTGNIRGISLTDKSNKWKYTASGKFRGSVYVSRGHVYGTTLDGNVVDIGDPGYVEPSALRWFKLKSWREIFNLGTNQ